MTLGHAGALGTTRKKQLRKRQPSRSATIKAVPPPSSKRSALLRKYVSTIQLRSVSIVPYLKSIARLIFAQQVLSFSSFIISLAAIVFTYNQNSLDVYYKETMVIPSLSLYVSDYDDALYLRNDGLGPAIIQFINIFEKGSDYIYRNQDLLKPLPASEIKEKFNVTYNVAAILEGALAEGLPSDIVAKGEKLDILSIVKAQNYRINSVTPNQSRQLFSLDKQRLIEYIESQKETLGDQYNTQLARANAPMSVFLDHADMEVCYCSISGRTCDVLTTSKFPEKLLCKGTKSVEYKSFWKAMFWFL